MPWEHNIKGGDLEGFVYPAILSSIALLVYYFTLFKAGMARLRFDVPAPSHEGPEEYVLTRTPSNIWSSFYPDCGCFLSP